MNSFSDLFKFKFLSTSKIYDLTKHAVTKQDPASPVNVYSQNLENNSVVRQISAASKPEGFANKSGDTCRVSTVEASVQDFSGNLGMKIGRENVNEQDSGGRKAENKHISPESSNIKDINPHLVNSLKSHVEELLRSTGVECGLNTVKRDGIHPETDNLRYVSTENIEEDSSNKTVKTPCPADAGSYKDIPQNFPKFEAGHSVSIRKTDSNGSTNISIPRTIGLLHGCTFILGAIIGTGIFVTPVSALKYSGSVGGALTVWCCSGLIALLGALCYMELGTTFPESGGDVIYIQRIWGTFPAFLCSWASLIVQRPGGKAIVSLTFANYVLMPFFPCTAVPQEARRLIAATVICLLTYINYRKITWATRVQDVFTFAKVSALIVIIIAGGIHLFAGHTENFQNAFEGTTKEPGNIALAFYSGLFTYGGWDFLNNVVEELKNPVRNLPRAGFISLALVTFIYVLVNTAYFAVLSPTEILSSNAVAVIFGDRTLGVMSWIMPLSVAMSTFGSLNGGIFGSARVLFVGARQGHLPSFLSMINVENYTPAPSLFLLCILSLVYLSTAEVYSLINYMSVVDMIFNTLSVGGIIWLRYKKPDLERPIKIPLVVHLTYLVICIFLAALPFCVNPWETGMGVIITLTGIPVYVVTVYRENKPECYRKLHSKVTFFIQKLLLSVPEEKSK